jgi:ribose 5-phosphate isomerase
MANNLNTNPVSIDTFAADVTISELQTNVKCATFSSPGADHCVMTDLAGNIVYDSRVSAGESDNQMIDTNVKGLVVDVSAGSFTAGAQLLVYLN